MCPECGGIKAHVKNASHDPEGNRIRSRLCETCGFRFSTIEVPFPFSMHEADATKRASPSYSARVKTPEYEPSRFEILIGKFGRLKKRRPSDPPRWAFTELATGNIAVIRLKRSSKAPRCRQGLHVMRNPNIYTNPTTGRRTCNACRRAAANNYYRNHLSPVTSISARRRKAQARKDTAA